jgi:hypothetical protein
LVGKNDRPTEPNMEIYMIQIPPFSGIVLSACSPFRRLHFQGPVSQSTLESSGISNVIATKLLAHPGCNVRDAVKVFLKYHCTVKSISLRPFLPLADFRARLHLVGSGTVYLWPTTIIFNLYAGSPSLVRYVRAGVGTCHLASA